MNIKPDSKSAIGASLVGAFFGAYLVGLRNLAPWNYAWLYSKGDGALTQLGFEFFRNAPMIQWPLTAVPQYVEGSNMILPTENAVANVLGKLFGVVFSGNFQFVGLWIVFCFATQGYFGAKLLSRFIDSAADCVLGSIFFIVSPALLFRIGVMDHYHLGAHWLILIALYLYFDQAIRIRAWSGLLFFAMLTSIYISAMVLVLFFATQIRQFLVRGTVGFARNVTPLVFAVLGFWIMGYLTMKSSVSGTNMFRLNAAAFLNPGFSDDRSFSLALNRLGNSRLKHLFSEEMEGFQYLGTVVIFGSLLGMMSALRARNLRNWRIYAPLIFISGILFIFSLSNRVVLMNHEFVYWWPAQLLDLRQIFRGTSRFGWPLYYLLTLFSIVHLDLFCKRKMIKSGFIIALAVMLLEAFPAIRYVHEELSKSVPYLSSIEDRRWGGLALNRSNIVIYPNFDLQVGEVTGSATLWVDRWFDLVKFAVDHDVSTNFGYGPRPLTKYLEDQDSQILHDLQTGSLNPRTIYLIADSAFWEKLRNQLVKVADCYQLDGLNIIVSKP